MKPKFCISHVRYDPVAQTTRICGWINKSDDIAQILLQSASGSSRAVLGGGRQDPPRHLKLAEYRSFDGRVSASPGERLKLILLNEQEDILQSLPVPTSVALIGRESAEHRIVEQFFETGVGHVTVLFQTSARTLPEPGLQIGFSSVQPLREIPRSKAKNLYREENDRYFLASFPMRNLSLDKLRDCRLYAGEAVLPLSPPASPIEIPSFSARIDAASQSEDSGQLLVMGKTNSPAVTSARLFIDDEMVGNSRTFIESKPKAPQSLQAHFFFEIPYPASSVVGRKAEVEFFVGDRSVGRAEQLVVGQKGKGSKLPSGPLNDRYGGLLYEFPVAPERAQLPWVALYLGMPAWPSTGGSSARTYSLARHLQTSGYRVLMIAQAQPGSHDWIPKMQGFCDALALARTVPVGEKYGHIDVQSYRRSDQTALRILPTLEAIFAPKAFIVNYAFNMYGAAALKTPVLLDAHDVQHLRAANARKNGGSMEDRRCTREEERRLLSMADSVFAITQEDAEQLEAVESGRPVFVAPHAQEATENPAITPESLRRLFFVGQKYAPNVEGIRGFIEKAWPSLRASCPEVELHVAGRVCESLQDLAGPGIHLHGMVPSLDEYYASCGVVLSPVPYGTGLKIKVVEGLARGRCVVATQEGRRGLSSEAPLVEAKLEDFSAEILKLIRNPGRAAALAAEAQRYAMRRFGPEQAYAAVRARLEALPPPEPVPPVEEAELLDCKVRGADVALELLLPEGAAKREFSMTLRHAGRNVFKVSRPALGRSGKAKFRMPLPLWLADGEPHEFELLWGSGARRTIRLRYGGPEFDGSGPLMPNWAARFALYDEIRILEPPLRLEEPSAAPPRRRLRRLEVRRQNRVVAHIGGWTPSQPLEGEALLAYLDLPPHLSSGPASDLLTFADLETGIVECLLPAGRLAGRRPAAPPPAENRSLDSLSGVWSPGWPLQAQAGGTASLDLFAEIPPSAGPQPQEAAFKRLATAIQTVSALQEVALVFPPGASEEDLLRWFVFVDGAPQTAAPALAFETEEARSVHQIALKAGETTRLELRSYSGFGDPPPAKPLLCRFR